MNPRGYTFLTILFGGLPSIVLWNILFLILLLMVRRALLAFSEMMSDLFVAAV